MLDIYEMQIFLSVAETGSFSEAGRRLQMSQPAVSMQIRSLETRLNVQLFHRAGRHISLTETGQTLIPMARDLVNMSKKIQENLISLQGEVIGSLTVACSTTSGKYILPRLFARFLDEHPLVKIACHVTQRGDALAMLLNGTADISVTSLFEPSRELEYRPFITDPVILIAPPDHPWAHFKTITALDLLQGRFIMREETSGTQQAVIQALSSRDITSSDLSTVMQLENSEAIYMAVAEGIGVAFISRRAAAEGLESGRVVEVHVADLEMVQQLYLVRPVNNLRAKASGAFWEFVSSPDSEILLDDCQVVAQRNRG